MNWGKGVRVLLAAAGVFGATAETLGYNSDYYDQDLTGHDFSNQDLRYDYFQDSILTNANFSRSFIKGISLHQATDYGFTSNQLYSTASYQDGDLSWIGLTDSELSGWEFSNKKLERAYFNESILSNTVFRSSNLEWAAFDKADLSGADFEGANLVGANFRDSTLSGANFENADIRHSNLGMATQNGFTSNQLYSTASYKTGDLSGINLELNDHQGWDFSELDLEYARFGGSNLSNVTFRSSNLRRADLFNTDLRNADLSGVYLVGADLGAARLVGADFSGADIRRANLEDTVQFGFTSNQLYSTASYKDGDLSDISLSFNEMSGWDFSGQNLQWARFWDTAMSNASFRFSNLDQASFEGSDLSYVDFTGANLEDARLSFVILEGASFENAIIRGADLDSGTDFGFTSNQLYSTASYKHGDLSYVNLSLNEMSGWDFSGLNLEKADICLANLSNAIFSSANAEWADFGSADLRHADFSEANLYRADLSLSMLAGADFEGALIGLADLGRVTEFGFTSNQFYSTASYRSGELAGIELDGNDLSSWNFSGKDLSRGYFGYSSASNALFVSSDLQRADFQSADLSFADFSNANLSFANFDRATLSGASMENAIINGVSLWGATEHGFTSNQLYSTASYQSGDLSDTGLEVNEMSGWYFSGIDLQHATFYGANLSNATFSSAVLERASFDGSNLELADLSAANLEEASFSGASLYRTDFSNAVIRYADFAGTTDYGFTSNQLFSTASYKSGDLEGINLSANEMSGWDFSNQNLVNASFYGAVLSNSVFSGSDLEYSELDRADLSFADLSGANLNGVYFGESDLTGADLSEATVVGAYFWDVYGFTSNQLYSTASYQSGDLKWISFDGYDVSGWDFSDQNLESAEFWGSVMSNTVLRSANLKGGSFVYADLTGADFSDANLEGAEFWEADLDGAKFDGAIIRYADLSAVAGLTSNQFYSTGSYIDKDLSGISFRENDLSGWDFSDQNMTGVDLEGTILDGTDLSGANLHDAWLAAVMPSFDVVNGAEISVRDSVRSTGRIQNQTGGSLYVRDLLLAEEYYQEAGARLRFSAWMNRSWGGYDAETGMLSVSGRAAFEAGAVLGVDSYSMFLADRGTVFTNQVISAGELVVDGVSNPTDLSSLTIKNSLIDADFYAEDHSVYAILRRLELAKVAGFAEGSMLEAVSDAIESSTSSLAQESLAMLDGMSGAQQNAQLRQRYDQGCSTFMHTQGMLTGQKQVLAQSRSFIAGNRKSTSAPSGALGPHNVDQELRGWMQGYGTWSDRESDGAQSGYDQNLFGTVVGLDRSFGNLLIGIAGGYAQSDLDQDNYDSSDAKTGYGVLYGSVGTVDWFGDMNVSYGRSRIDTTSGSTLGGSYSTDADSYSVYAGGGKEFMMRDDRFVVTPEGSLLVTYFNQQGYVDGLMNVDDYDRWSYLSRLGSSFALKQPVGNIMLKPELRAYWLHEFNADADRIGYSMGGTGRYAFGVRGPDEDTFEAGAGLGAEFNDRLELVFDLDGQVSEHYQAVTVSGRIEVEF